MQEPGLLNGLILRGAYKVLNNVARIAARRLANDLAAGDVAGFSGPILHAAAQLGPAKAFRKGSNERMLAGTRGQAAKGNGGGTRDARPCQSLPHLADEAAGRPRAPVDAEQDGLRAAAQRQIRSEVSQAGALWQH